MKRLKTAFESLDEYGSSLKINYKGEDTIKTSFGALCRVLGFGFVFTLFILGANEVLSY